MAAFRTIDDEDFMDIKDEVQSTPIQGVDDQFRIMLISLKRILYEDIIFDDETNDSDKSQDNRRTDMIVSILAYVYDIIAGNKQIDDSFDGIRPLLLKLKEAYAQGNQQNSRAYSDYLYNSLKGYPYYMRDIATQTGGSIVDIDR